MDRRSLLRAGVGALVAGSAGCADVAVEGDAWPMFGSDPGNTRHQPDGTGPAGAASHRWRVDTGDALWNVVDSSPAVADETVRLTYRTGDAVRSSPAVVDGAVYVGSRDGAVYALD